MAARRPARRSTATQAYGSVDVPEAVIDLLTGVRNYLQARPAARAAAQPWAPPHRDALRWTTCAPALSQPCLWARSPQILSAPSRPAGQVRAAGVRLRPALHEGRQDAAGGGGRQRSGGNRAGALHTALAPPRGFGAEQRVWRLQPLFLRLPFQSRPAFINRKHPEHSTR